MKSKITALSLTGLLSVSHASAETPVAHQSVVGDKNHACNLEQGNVYYCKDCCTEEKKRLDSITEKLDHADEKLPQSVVTRAKRLIARNNNDLARKWLEWSDSTYSASFEETQWLLGNEDKKIGKNKEALMHYKKAVVLNEEKNPKYLMSAGKMARDYGEYEEAKKWLEKILQIRLAEKKNDINLAEASRELAVLYDDDRCKKDDQDKAEKLYQEALKIYEEEYGINSKHYATVLCDIANYHRRRNNYLKAEPLFERCLDIMGKISDENDPYLAMFVADFALIQKENGKIEEADQLFSRALRICDAASILGTDCDDIGMIKNNVAEFYESQERYKEAEQRYEEALSILKAKLSNGHKQIDEVQRNYDRMKQKMTE
ncbi:tetratricopeptide repeat protein [Candidatus Electronema sp. TJ]|uniref:tetratricopeptide repeat protein n=1 Tax=Candidatus Electronema sp. TJ TaxID=3401573 RepID=UPI003AA83A0E